MFWISDTLRNKNSWNDHPYHLKILFKKINVSLKMACEQPAHFRRYEHFIIFFNEVGKNSLNSGTLKKRS